MLRKLVLLCLSLFIILPVLAQEEPEEPTYICPAFTTASDSDRTSYYMGEGAAFLRSSNYDAAINAYGCIIQQIDDSYVNAYLNRAVAYTARREYNEALEDYDDAIALNSNFAPAYSNRGVLYTAIEDYEAARSDFQRAISIDSDYVYAYVNLGVLDAIEGNLEAAEANFLQAIEIAGLEDVLVELRDPERDPEEPLPSYDSAAARAYALLGTIHSTRALDAYDNYLLLVGGRADERIRSAAGALESRFQFELRFDDGSWMLLAGFQQQ